jgi:ATP-dependent DNA helicase PIF1
LDITAKSYSSLENKGKEADLIRNTDIFIWDEAPMASRHIMNIIDKKLKELMKNNKPFGGKTFILSGDVRQVLPIKRNATRTEIVDLLIKNSSLWPNFKTCKLTQNMRADPNEIEFAQQLIDIGDGKSADEGYITIPDSCICETDLVEEIFGDIIKNKNYSELANRAILATLNTNVDDYNHRVLEAFPGEYLEPYFSFDETNPDTKFPVSLDILNAHNSSSLPDHALRLKKDCILMLMRNLNLKQGLSNGTRLQVVNPMKNVLQCIIITGHKKGETAFIPRITLIEDKRLPYILKRHQFPVKLAFAFSINKSQSQTFTKVGIDFQNEVFAHGQCYVALSRAKSWNGIKVVLDPENTEKKIRNIVWKEVLED